MLSNYANDTKLFNIGKDNGSIKAILAKDFGTVNFIVLNTKKFYV